MALLRWLQRNVVAGEVGLVRDLIVTGASVSVATGARWLLGPLLGDTVPFAPYYPAVLAAALTGGWRSGTATLVLSSIVGWFLFMARPGEPLVTTVTAAAVVTFTMTAGLVLGAAALLRQAVTELVAARELGDRLNQELQHRVKNTLMVVQSLATQTARRSGGDLRAFEDAFAGRLRALGFAHDVLISGKLRDCRLPQLAEDALRPFTDAYRERIVMTGETAVLPTEACVPLVLALHEMATNAVKHGALSNESGQVELRWQVERRQGADAVRLRWVEQNGPMVRAPTRFGFGSRLLRPAPAQHLHDVHLDFAATGLVCEILVRPKGDHAS